MPARATNLRLRHALVVVILLLGTVPALADQGPANANGVVTPDTRQAVLVAAEAAQIAADAAKAAAEAAHITAQAVHDLAGHVEDIEHTEPSVAPAIPVWAYRLALNALSNTGNAQNFSGQASLEVDGHWHKWRTNFVLRGAYGASDPVGDKADQERQVTALNGTASVRGERYYMPFLSSYALLQAYSNLVSSIQYQASGELGITLTWFEVERDGYVKRRLRTSVAIEAMHEARKQYFPTRVPGRTLRWIIGPPVTFDFRYALAKNIYVQQDLKILIDVKDVKDWRLTSQTTLAAAITDHVGLQIGYSVNYIGVPAKDRLSTDRQLSAGINFTF